MTGGLRVFLRTSFSPISFSAISFNGASAQPEKQDGRSGYWRLFFQQLQEEADKPKTTEPTQVEAEVVAVKTKAVAKPVKVKKPVKVMPEEPEVVPPFRPLPMYESKPDEPTHLQQMWNITTELRVMIKSLSDINDEFDILRQQQDEDDVELLLLFS
jgi:hypothetical protein